MEILDNSKLNNLYCRMSGKKDGSMKEEENRKSFLEKIGVSSVARAGLCHKNKIALVQKKDRGKTIEGVDGLMTKEENLFLSITVADCLPIIFYNPIEGKIGLLHAGWRGLYSGIIENVETDFKDTFFFIGPGISKCHFEVKKDFPLPCYEKNGRYFSDLKKIAKDKIKSLNGKSVEVNPDCTYCLKDKYFSYRREGRVNAMMVVLGKNPPFKRRA